MGEAHDTLRELVLRETLTLSSRGRICGIGLLKSGAENYLCIDPAPVIDDPAPELFDRLRDLGLRTVPASELRRDSDFAARFHHTKTRDPADLYLIRLDWVNDRHVVVEQIYHGGNLHASCWGLRLLRPGEDWEIVEHWSIWES